MPSWPSSTSEEIRDRWAKMMHMLMFDNSLFSQLAKPKEKTMDIIDRIFKMLGDKFPKCQLGFSWGTNDFKFYSKDAESINLLLSHLKHRCATDLSYLLCDKVNITLTHHDCKSDTTRYSMSPLFVFTESELRELILMVCWESGMATKRYTYDGIAKSELADNPEWIGA